MLKASSWGLMTFSKLTLSHFLGPFLEKDEVVVGDVGIWWYLPWAMMILCTVAETWDLPCLDDWLTVNSVLYGGVILYAILEMFLWVLINFCLTPPNNPPPLPRFPIPQKPSLKLELNFFKPPNVSFLCLFVCVFSKKPRIVSHKLFCTYFI